MTEGRSTKPDCDSRNPEEKIRDKVGDRAATEKGRSTVAKCPDSGSVPERSLTWSTRGTNDIIYVSVASIVAFFPNDFNCEQSIIIIIHPILSNADRRRRKVKKRWGRGGRTDRRIYN